jgi:hypothetical protein
MSGGFISNNTAKFNCGVYAEDDSSVIISGSVTITCAHDE